MTSPTSSRPARTGGGEHAWRALAPEVLGALVRRYGHFADAEDAVQEALFAASTQWPVQGVPADPRAWLVRVASRRLIDGFRSDDARRRRELVAGSWSIERAQVEVSGQDDSLVLMYRCCHPALSPSAAIALTLRAVGGLTTREIAAAFLVPEATMARRITRAKATLRAIGEPFALPAGGLEPERVAAVLHVVYLLFNEGYASTAGEELARTELSGEAIRLARLLHAARPDDPEISGLLALLLLTDARRPARTGAGGELVPLMAQDRRRWDRAAITEGIALVTEALRARPHGVYLIQAAVAAVHDRAASHAETNWGEIVALYTLLDRLSPNPMVRLNRAIALAMVDGPQAGLDALEPLDAELGDHLRLRAARAHLAEMAGDTERAVAEYDAAARRATNERERQYLVSKAAGLR